MSQLGLLEGLFFFFIRHNPLTKSLVLSLKRGPDGRFDNAGLANILKTQ